MKHVWILNHYAQLPSENGGLTRHHSLARQLPSNGWRASIIAACTEHPSGRRRENTDTMWTVDDIPFLWIKTPEYCGNGRDRIINMLAYAWRAFLPTATSNLAKPDAIIGSSPHPAAALAGYMLARRHKVPFIFEVRDLWPQVLIDMGRITESSLTARAMRTMEAFLFRAAARSITLWPNVEAYQIERQINAHPPVWIPNGIDLHYPTDAGEHPERNTFTLMYLGAHGNANGLENPIRAMRLVQDLPNCSHIRLRLIGDGPQKASLQHLARELGVNNVVFDDPVSKENVPVIAHEADAFLFNLVNIPAFRYGISPNKLHEYMAMHRPVIFCCDAYNNPIEESGGGVTVKPNQPDLLARAIADLAATPREQRIQMAICGRNYVEKNHGFDKLAAKLAEVLNSSI